MSMFANISQTANTLLTTVQIAANSTARSITTVASTLDMADEFVQTAKKKQIVNNEFEMENYVTIAKSNAWEAHAHQVTQLEKRLNADADLKKNYMSLKSDYDAIEARINERLKTLTDKAIVA